MAVYFGVPAKPVSDCRTSDAWWNSGSQLRSNSVHLWHRRLCSGRQVFHRTHGIKTI